MKDQNKKVKFTFSGRHQLVSPLAEKILKCIKEEYNGIAETCNIEYSLSLTPRTIASALKPIIKAGHIKCIRGGGTLWNNNQYGGSIYKLKQGATNGRIRSRKDC